MRRRTKSLLIALGVIVVLIILASGPGVGFYTELLWYDDVGFGNIFGHRIVWQILLFLIGAVLFAVIAAVNVFIARKASPLRPLAITNDVLFQLRRTLDPAIRWILLGAIIIIALIFGGLVFPEWQPFTLFFNSESFGVTDPVFNRDVGFYVFALPILRFVFGWLFGALVVTLILIGCVYGYAGAIGPQPEGGYISPNARNHIAIVLGFLMLLKAFGYQLNQWELLYSPQGVVEGASYTDVNAQLPAFRVLFWIAIIAALLLFATFFTKRLVLPIVAIALMAISALVIGGIYPRIVQQFQVTPNEVEKETPFIARNIEFTRQGFGLDKVQTSEFPADPNITDAELAQNENTIQNVRLWDDDPLLTSYRQIQELRPYYNFETVGVDRYDISGRTTQTLMSAREVAPSQLDERARTWQNIHLIYTHGFGAAVSQSNRATPSGGPDLLVKNLPPVNETDNTALDLTQPRIYFGQQTNEFVVVGTTLDELDRPLDVGATAEDEIIDINEPDTPEGADAANAADEAASGNVERYRYEGDSGIKLDSIIKKLAFAIKFGQTQFILSNAIQPESQLLVDREVSARVQKVAPFLQLDRNPYLVALQDRMVWVLDAYTQSPMYPYSQPVPEGVFTGGTNYIRNSVKAVVDAYTGDVTLYRVDMADPIAQAWANAIPGLMQDDDTVPEELRAHFRYPQDLFEAQLVQYRAYHMDNSIDFYNQEDLWSIAQRAQAGATTAQQASFDAQSQYLELRLPGSEGEEFVLFNSYTPATKDNLVSIFMARSDPANYGELVNLILPRQRLVNGPRQVEAQIQQEPVISEQITLLNQSGSRIQFGQIRIVPVGDSLIYVQPLFLRSTDAARPELKRVVVGFGDRVVMEPTFTAALVSMFGFSPIDGTSGAPAPSTGAPTPSTGAPTPQTPTTTVTQQVEALINTANDTYSQMQEALRQGNLEQYAKLETQLGSTLEQLRNLSPNLG